MNQQAVEPVSRFSAEEKAILKQVARNAIQYGLQYHGYQPIEIEKYPPTLREAGACFVTLKKSGQLRGCIGSLEPHRALVADVAHNAYAAAFSDHRFPPLAVQELAEVELDISVLSAAEPISFTSETDLLQQIRPGIDGLILEEGMHRGTFLPSVWESLPDAESFLRHLKQKAGLPPDYWSPSIKILRYTSESF